MVAKNPAALGTVGQIVTSNMTVLQIGQDRLNAKMDALLDHLVAYVTISGLGALILTSVVALKRRRTKGRKGTLRRRRRQHPVHESQRPLLRRQHPVYSRQRPVD